MTIWVIILLLCTFDVLWWHWADRCLRPLRRSGPLRVFLAAFALFEAAGMWSIIASRRCHFVLPLPASAIAAVYLWHLIIVPTTAVVLLLGGIASGMTAGWRWARGKTRAQAAEHIVSQPTGPSRRQVLVAAAALAPPVMTGGIVAIASRQHGAFRIRRLVIPLASLPADLDGLTIAHISDVHTGRFTNQHTLDSIAERTNRLKPDLVAITGDLIDFSLADLPASLDMVRRLDSRYGVFMCEGNHDLVDDRDEFESQVKAAGVPLLVNESAMLTVRGHPVQFLGLRWGAYVPRRDGEILREMRQILPQRRPDAFPILLSHHPHAFDAAAQASIPLVLSGHTHGGQIMLTRHIGPGPVMYRYWSGLYWSEPAHRRGSALVVSNGVGNWFPFRLNAPEEIVHITLRRS